MRISTWLCPVVSCLIVAYVLASLTPLSARPYPPAIPKTVLKQEFQGYGLTPKDAEANALERACDWLAANANLGWTPTPEFLRGKEGAGAIQFGERSVKKSGIAKDFGGRLQVVQLRLEVTDEQVREMQELGRNQRIKERQKLSLLSLIGAVCLLGVVGGYLRLEEATKGYYTRLLRLAAVSVLLIVVAGLWVLR